ncbi:hypothetical protein [Amycolatopsis sp. NPDC003731]
MGWDEVEGNGGGDYEERERLSTKIGAEFEGTVVRVGNLREGDYGPVRWVDIDTPDGTKANFPAGKILLERIEAAGLNPGDRIKVVIESAKTKDGKHTYALPRVFVDRGAGESKPAAKKAAPKKAAPAKKAEPAPAAPAADYDDDPPF